MAIYKVLFEKLYTILTLLTMDLFFEAAHRLMGGGGGGGRSKKAPHPKIRLT